MESSLMTPSRGSTDAPTGLFSLQDKSALVTGAGGGLGSVLCRGFARAGAKVACVDADVKRTGSVVESLERARFEAIPVVCDVTQPELVASSVERVVAAFGQLDILVNLAGRGIMKPTVEITLEERDGVVNVFLRSAFQLCQSVGRHIVEHGAGSIIDFSSLASLVALGGGCGTPIATPKQASTF